MAVKMIEAKQLPPPEQRLYSFDEIVLMLDGWADDWHDMGEPNADAVRAWVEHMDAGDLPVGVPGRGA